MGLSSKLTSSRKTVREDVDTKDIAYVSAADLAASKGIKYPIPVIGFFTKTGDYGKQITLIVEIKNEIMGVNIPKRYAEMFEAFNAEEVEQLKDGALGIAAIVPDVKTPKGKTTMIEFCDL